MLLPLLIIFFLPITIHAEPLPINIEVIGRPERRENAVTTRLEVDLFSCTSLEINEALERQREEQMKRAQVVLFNPVLMEEELPKEEWLLAQVTNHQLFHGEISFREGVAEDLSEEIPLWMIVGLFVVCGVGGFVIAKLSLQKKETREATKG